MVQSSKCNARPRTSRVKQHKSSKHSLLFEMAVSSSRVNEPKVALYLSRLPQLGYNQATINRKSSHNQSTINLQSIVNKATIELSWNLRIRYLNNTIKRMQVIHISLVLLIIWITTTRANTKLRIQISVGVTFEHLGYEQSAYLCFNSNLVTNYATIQFEWFNC